METVKKASKADKSKKKINKQNISTNTNQNNSNNTAQQTSNTNAKPKQPKVTNHATTQQKQVPVTNNNTNTHPQSATIIQNSDQAAALVDHSMGGAAKESMNVKQETDGYHVWFDTGSKNPIVTVVKSNGDFHDVNGNLIGTYAKMSAPDGIYYQ